MKYQTRKKTINPPVKITIKDKNIEQLKWTKFLGIRIDEHMT